VTIRAAGAAFIVSLIVGVWAILVIPMEVTAGSVWKFGVLYIIMFVVWLLERGARKEAAEEKLATVPKQIADAKAEGIEIGLRGTWRDRYNYAKVTRHLNARHNAVSALMGLCNHSAPAMAIIDTMNAEINKADQEATMEIAAQIEQLGILKTTPKEPPT